MELNFLKSLIIPKPELRFFNVNLVDHCNLNCKYCDHFSPIAEEYYVDIDELERDFKQISKFVKVMSVALMGGEPLLHPNLIEILKMSRRTLKSTRLDIFTNGILLDKQNSAFWETCKKNNIGIKISRYPIQLNLNKIISIAKKYGVSVSFYGGDLNTFKTMFKLSLDIDGSQNAEEMSRICWQNNGGCSYFGHGRLYQCTTAGHINHLNKYFGLNFKVTEDDYIDIYKLKNGQEVLDFYKKVIPFCRYCKVNKQVENLPFEISKKEKDEWI